MRAILDDRRVGARYQPDLDRRASISRHLIRAMASELAQLCERRLE